MSPERVSTEKSDQQARSCVCRIGGRPRLEPKLRANCSEARAARITTKDGSRKASVLPSRPAPLLVAGVDFSRPRRMDRSAGVALGLSEHGLGPSCRADSVVGIAGGQLFEHPGGTAVWGADRLRAGGLVLRHALCDPGGDQPARYGDRGQCRRRIDPGIALNLPVRQKPIMDQRGYRHDSGGGGLPLACPSGSWPRHRASRFRPATFGSGYRLAAVAQGCGAACLYQRLARHANRSDLLNLDKVQGLGAPIASIGGAGTFDGIFLTGILAVLIASIFGPSVSADDGAGGQGARPHLEAALTLRLRRPS